MKYTAALVLASAALASAQGVKYNSTTGQFICPPEAPEGAFCAGTSLSTNIIIRCHKGIGQPGNCNDNLAGYPPMGVQPAQCWQSTETAGDAACSKNCIVYGASGKANGTFTLPDCTPYYTATSSTVAPTTTPSGGNSTTITYTGTTTCTTDGTTTTKTYTTTYCPDTETLSTVTVPSTTPVYPTSLPTGYPTGTGGQTTPGNGTTPTYGGNGGNGASSTGSPTATPVGPTSSGTTTPFEGGAMSSFGGGMTHAAGAGLGAVAVFVAYFL